MSTLYEYSFRRDNGFYSCIICISCLVGFNTHQITASKRLSGYLSRLVDIGYNYLEESYILLVISFVFLYSCNCSCLCIRIRGFHIQWKNVIYSYSWPFAKNNYENKYKLTIFYIFVLLNSWSKYSNKTTNTVIRGMYKLTYF